MPIKVVCQCGQAFAAKDELAGKRVKCPKCAAILTIPSARSSQAGVGQNVSSLLDDAGMRSGVERCPGCGAEIGPSAVLCVMCGFDRRLGHRLKTRLGSAVVVDDEELGDLPVHGNPVLDAAERQIARDKIEQSRLATGAPWWMLLLAFLGLVGFAVAMVSLPQESVMDNSGLVLQGAGGLIIALYGLRLLITAFKESVLQGLLVLLVPPYILYYVGSRWDRVAGMVIFIVIGGVVVGLGFVLIAVAPYVQNLKADGENTSLLRFERRPAVVMVCGDSATVS
ncbi:MAG: hypothetical protein ACYC6N_28700 [Pirellulaceae bacterium]